MNVILSGNLENTFNTFPAFPGKEKHFLKALLVRITHGSIIVPKGEFAQDENRNSTYLALEIKLDPDFKMPDLNELSNPENWSFLHPQILNCGRVNYPPDLNEEDESAMKEADPQAERLSPISTAKGK